ncbi:MAG: DNA internalization-related competence protein ComEC/Rec2 [Tissierellia bacterium]|nr:DNA internalization-related competence protein ComEC/Rec2 [Tissierellia bacterium]
MGNIWASLSLAFVVGLLSHIYIELDFIFCLLLGGGFFVLFQVLGKRKAGLLCLAFSLGLVYLPFWSLFQPDLAQGRLEGEGVVVSRKEGQLQLASAQVGEEKGLRLVLYTKSTPAIGSRVYFRGLAQEGEGAMNPGGQDRILRDLSQGIHGRIQVHKLEETGEVHRVYQLREAARNWARQLFSAHLTKGHSQVMGAMTLGDHLDWDQTQTYRDLGLAHILSISGLHVGLVKGFLDGLLDLTPLAYKKRRLLTHGFLGLFIFFVGWPIGALRVWAMLAFLDLGSLFDQEVDPLYSLFFVGLVFLFYRPYYLFNLGFLLSFSSLMGIYSLGQWFLDHGFNQNSLTQSLGISLAVLIFTGPILNLFLGEVPLMGLVANLLLIPLYSLAMGLGFLMVTFGLISQRLIGLFALSLDGFLALGDLVVGLLHPYRLGLSLGPSGFFWLLAYYGVLYFLLSGAYRDFSPYLARVYILQSLFLVLIFFLALGLAPKALRLTMIYVGQGDSFLIEYGDYKALIDTGGTHMEGVDPGKKYTLRTLRALGVSHLDEVFISHFDKDHYQGIFSLAEGIKIDRIISAYYPQDKETQEALGGLGIPWLVQEDYRREEGPLKLRGLSLEDQGQDENDKSLLLRLDYGPFSALFTGDLTQAGEKKILDRLQPVTLLKLGHHGSKTSSSGAFLDRIRPRLALISSGKNNPYGHPHREVLDRLDQRGIPYFQSKEEGCVQLYLEGDRLSYRTYLPREKISLSSYGGLGLLALAYGLAGLKIISDIRRLEEAKDGDQRFIWQ